MRQFLSKCLYLLLIVAPFGLSAQALSTAEYPPSANVGQCFARVLTPDVVQTTTEQVQDSPARTTQAIIPASYETQNIRVQVKEATTGYRTIAAVYETVAEQVLVEPAREVLVSIPAKYETWTETVEIEPARLVWKTGSGLYGRETTLNLRGISQNEMATGEVLCRVMQPAKTRTVRRTRMVEPARTETQTIPAKYRTVTRQVVQTPPRVEEFTIEAMYADVPVQVMVQPERIIQNVIPATYRTVERQVVTKRGGMEWAEVLCETNASQAKIAEVQRGLVQSGYTVTVDGIYGPQTQRAMESFQRSNGLAVGYMTVETVTALNVNPYA